MKRKFYIVILLALVPALANALGLGNLDLNSALNEPFDARIQLLSPTADELDSLTVNLADSNAFARAKIDRPFILSKLKFSLRRSVDDGPDYIRVYSQDPIREPFLNFLVEVSWSNGRLFREYTVLLDPPLYDPTARDSKFTRSQPSSGSMAEPVTLDDPAHKVIYTDDFEQTSSSVASPNVNYTGGDYGPISESETLWSIASAMRPDTSTSVNQMMLALLRANPEAFLNQNINGLKRGQILRMPNESELAALSNAEALANVQSQHAAWDNIKDNLSGAVTERPEVSSVPESSATDADMVAVEEMAETDAELKLVAADDTDKPTQQVASVDSGTGDELVLAQESIQALTRENMELRDRLQESEALLDDLKRLLSLKDDELAALQEQAITSEGMAEEAEPIVDESMSDTEQETVTEVEEAMDEQAAMEDADEMIVDDEEAEMPQVAEEEVIEVIESEPTADSEGIMGMVEQYLGPVKEILLGNPMIGMAIAAVLIVLIIIIVIMKFKKESAETIDIDAMTEEAFPDFDSSDLGGDEMPESEAVTVLPDADAEAETVIKEEAVADIDHEAENQFAVEGDTPVEDAPVDLAPAEEESDEDPLQEVNTYLAFEQFDQAEEFVRNVIKDDPDNPEYHTKLLEVFYTSGNKKGYEEEAKVLHEKVGGEGEHWNMAVAMWQEMSPSRALFEAGGGEEEDDAADTTSGGFVDVTADDETSEDSGGLDFDIGGAEDDSVDAEQPAAEAEEEILDITATDEGEDILDVTAAVGLEEEDDMLDISSASTSSDDLLDVTAAVGLDEVEDNNADDGADDVLDITSSEESSGEDLLDVTAASDLDLDSEEDLLDVTAATGAGADSSELLGFEIENSDESKSTHETDAEKDNASDSDESADDDNLLDFDLGTSEDDNASDSDESTDDDNLLDFDLGTSDEDAAPEIEAGETDADDAGLEIDLAIPESDSSDTDDNALDMSLNMTEDNSEIKLDVAEDAAAGDDADDEISLDFDMSEDDEAKAESSEFDLEIGADDEAPAEDNSDSDMDFELSLDDDSESSDNDISLDLDGTVEIPKSGDADDDDDDDHTVFVPRASQPDEQSADDEIATKLDLAKAYVELGDKDSAKVILDEVMADGNDEQRKQAEDLLGQC